MRKLIYKIESYTLVDNLETGEVEKQLNPAEMIVYNPTEEDIARAAEIAYNGEYAVIDDDTEEG